MAERLASIKHQAAARSASEKAAYDARMEQYGREVLGMTPEEIANVEANIVRHNKENLAKAAPILRKMRQYEAEVAAMEARRPLDSHTLTSTWTDSRGKRHRVVTTCTFYRYETTCHTDE